MGGAATLPTRKVDASFAVRDTRTLGEEATEALAPQGSEVPTAPFVLVDVEGTQSRDRGGAEGVEFDSRWAFLGRASRHLFYAGGGWGVLKGRRGAKRYRF